MKIRYFEKRPGAWHLDFRLADGTRVRPYGGPTRALAEKQAPAILAQTLSSGPSSGTTAQVSPALTSDGPTLDQAYRKALRVRESWITSKAKGTLQTTFDAILATAGAGLVLDTPLATMTRDKVRDLRGRWLVEPGKRQGTTLSRSTINHRLSMLTVLLEVADLPPHGVKHLSVKGNRRTRRITDAEITQACGWCFANSARRGALGMRDMILLALDCGAREGELLGLTWDDCMVDSVTFHDTKNGESRTVPLTERSARILEARRGLPAPFADLTQGRLVNLWSDMRKALGLATDDEFVFHCLRHEAISRWIDAGGNAFTVQALAGHANITTTQVYAHAGIEAMRRVVNSRRAAA